MTQWKRWKKRRDSEEFDPGFVVVSPNGTIQLSCEDFDAAHAVIDYNDQHIRLSPSTGMNENSYEVDRRGVIKIGRALYLLRRLPDKQVMVQCHKVGSRLVIDLPDKGSKEWY